MSLYLTLRSSQFSDDRLYATTRDLCQALNQQDAIQARLGETGVAESGARGEIVDLGNIVLTFLSSGAAVALFEVIKSYLMRDSSMSFMLEVEGKKFELSVKNMSGTQMDDLLVKFQKYLDLQEAESEK